jgi:hypothetical protein
MEFVRTNSPEPQEKTPQPAVKGKASAVQKDLGTFDLWKFAEEFKEGDTRSNRIVTRT